MEWCNSNADLIRTCNNITVVKTACAYQLHKKNIYLNAHTLCSLSHVASVFIFSINLWLFNLTLVFLNFCILCRHCQICQTYVVFSSLPIYRKRKTNSKLFIHNVKWTHMYSFILAWHFFSIYSNIWRTTQNTQIESNSSRSKKNQKENEW